MITSFVGLYSLPVLRSLRPVRKDTPMPTIIINSSIVLVVASALPVAVNTVGMTTFDLLGSHSSLQWLGSFRVVVAYNTLFVVLSVAFLFNQLTASMRRQIWKWICQLRCGIRRESDADETIEILRGDKKSNWISFLFQHFLPMFIILIFSLQKQGPIFFLGYYSPFLIIQNHQFLPTSSFTCLFFIIFSQAFS